MAKSPILLTREELKRCLSYDPETGVFTWAFRARNSIKIGDVAGSMSRSGYQYIGINGKRYLAHRLAWLYVQGVWPENDVDHINRIKTDNRIANLRDATKSQNLGNSKTSRKNTSGVKGVCWHRHIRKWQATIHMHGKNRHLGYFATREAAAEAYRAAAENHHGEFARFG